MDASLGNAPNLNRFADDGVHLLPQRRSCFQDLENLDSRRNTRPILWAIRKRFPEEETPSQYGVSGARAIENPALRFTRLVHHHNACRQLKMVLQPGNAPEPSAYQAGALLLSYRRNFG